MCAMREPAGAPTCSITTNYPSGRSALLIYPSTAWASRTVQSTRVATTGSKVVARSRSASVSEALTAIGVRHARLRRANRRRMSGSGSSTSSMLIESG